MPIINRDPARVLRSPADGTAGAPGGAPPGPINNVVGPEAPQGQCIAGMITGAIDNVLSNISSVVEAAVVGGAKGGTGGAGKAAIGETANLGFSGVRDALGSDACETAIAENADRANNLGLGAIVAP